VLGYDARDVGRISRISAAPIQSVFQLQMLLNAPEACFQFRDDDTMADDGGMVFDDGAAQANDLIRKVFSGRVDFRVEAVNVGGDIGSERVHVRSELGDIVFRRHVLAHLAKHVQDETFGLLGHLPSFSGS
jgi:hypothetical protein